MQGFIYHMTLKSHFTREFYDKTSIVAISKRDIVMDVKT